MSNPPSLSTLALKFRLTSTSIFSLFERLLVGWLCFLLFSETEGRTSSVIEHNLPALLFLYLFCGLFSFLLKKILNKKVLIFFNQCFSFPKKHPFLNEETKCFASVPDE